MLQWVKPPLVLPPSPTGVLMESWLLCFGSSVLLLYLRRQWMMAQVLETLPHIWKTQDRIPGFWSCLGKILTVVAILVVNQLSYLSSKKVGKLILFYLFIEDLFLLERQIYREVIQKKIFICLLIRCLSGCSGWC